jgi:hypothetical protein
VVQYLVKKKTGAGLGVREYFILSGCDMLTNFVVKKRKDRWAVQHSLP